MPNLFQFESASKLAFFITFSVVARQNSNLWAFKLKHSTLFIMKNDFIYIKYGETI